MNEKQLTKQEVFDFAYNFYKKGGLPGYDCRAGGCIYFGNHGERCAVGVLLDHLGFTRGDLNTRDRNFNEESDVTDVIKLLGEKFTKHLALDVYQIDNPNRMTGRSFLQRLQKAHDYAAEDGDSGDVCDSLFGFAQAEGLVSTK